MYYKKQLILWAFLQNYEGSKNFFLPKEELFYSPLVKNTVATKNNTSMETKIKLTTSTSNLNPVAHLGVNLIFIPYGFYCILTSPEKFDEVFINNFYIKIIYVILLYNQDFFSRKYYFYIIDMFLLVLNLCYINYYTSFQKIYIFSTIILSVFLCYKNNNIKKNFNVIIGEWWKKDEKKNTLKEHLKQ